MIGGKFSRQLETSKRKWSTELKHEVPAVGSWNADATDSSRPSSDFSEMVNMRKMRADEVETRSGYKQWSFPGVKHPVAKAEYRLDQNFVDITLYAENGNLVALILDCVAGTTITLQICPCGAAPIVCAAQYSTMLIVSVIAPDLADPGDCGTWALTPTDPTLKSWATPFLLGKYVSPTPGALTFSPTTTGPLLVYTPQAFDKGGLFLKYTTDAITGEYITVAVDIKANYWLSGSAPVSLIQEKLWVRGKTDVPNDAGKNSTEHVKSRGWQYVAVLKKRIKDARGQYHVVAMAPSPDWYVEDKMYIPATPGFQRNGKWEFTDLIYSFYDQIYGYFAGGGFGGTPTIDLENAGYSHWRDGVGLPPGKSDAHDPDVTGSAPWGFRVGDKSGGQTNVSGYPSNADYLALRAKFRDLVPSASDDGDPMYFAAEWLGWYDGSGGDGGHPPNVHYEPNGIPPYKIACSSYELTKSPNVVFNWSDFGITDPDAYQIDLYRTAYSYPNEKDNATRSTEYQPYRFGYVGTIDKDGSFTDNIADTGILFDITPLDQEGYLSGQFAGEVIAQYQDRVVLGNTRTKFWLKAPWGGIQAFMFNNFPAGTSYATTDFDAANPANGCPAGDGNPKTWFFYAYKDQDGNLSDASAITVEQHGHAIVGVAFQFPRGYSVLTVSAVLIKSVWDNGQNKRRYFIETTMTLSEGTYLSANPPTSGLVEIFPTLNGTTLGMKTVETSNDPGYIIWSSVNNAWSWPQENIENEHDQDPVTGFGNVIGPLYVLSDKGVVMTRLNGYREPVLTSVTGAGCIGRNACVKVNKVLFFLSAFGLCYVEGSGVVQFNRRIHTEIIKYIREAIPGQPKLANARRASMSYLGQRSELWITFPSSADLGGKLPARTFIVKFLSGNEGQEVHAYEFELANPNPTHAVIYLPHADGSLFSAFFADEWTGQNGVPIPPQMIVQDNDVPDLQWTGSSYLQYQDAMGYANLTKMIFSARFVAEAHCDLFLVRGMLRTDGGYDRDHGTINPVCQSRELTIMSDGEQAPYHIPFGGDAVETSGNPPAVRWVTRPNSNGEHRFRLQAIELFFGLLHAHKGD